MFKSDFYRIRDRSSVGLCANINHFMFWQGISPSSLISMTKILRQKFISLNIGNLVQIRTLTDNHMNYKYNRIFFLFSICYQKARPTNRAFLKTGAKCGRFKLKRLVFSHLGLINFSMDITFGYHFREKHFIF